MIEVTYWLGGAYARYVYNVAFSFDKMWHRHQSKMHSRTNIELKYMIIICQRIDRIEDASKPTKASIVDKNIQSIKSTYRLTYEPLSIRLVCYVGNNFEWTNSFRWQFVTLFCNSRHVCCFSSSDHNTSTSLSKHSFNATTYSRAWTSNQRNFSFEVEIERHLTNEIFVRKSCTKSSNICIELKK